MIARNIASNSGLTISPSHLSAAPEAITAMITNASREIRVAETLPMAIRPRDGARELEISQESPVERRRFPSLIKVRTERNARQEISLEPLSDAAAMLGAMGATIGILAIFIGLERLWPASSTQRGEWINNGVALVLTTLSQSFLVAAIAAWETHLINALGGGFIDLRGLPLIVGAAIYVVAMDGGEYLFHRAQHKIPWLWAMHSLHHSDRAVNVLTTQRHFWLEPALKALSIWLLVALIFKSNVHILVVYFIIAQYNFLFHSNIPLGFGRFSWLVNSPAYHRLHHSRRPEHYNSNFAAQLPIFDVLTGAYRRPERGQTPDTGLDEFVSHPLRGDRLAGPRPLPARAVRVGGLTDSASCARDWAARPRGESPRLRRPS